MKADQRSQAPGEPVEKNAPAPPCTMVIFGGAGDLAKRKLFPALYNLRRAGRIPDAFAIISIAREAIETQAFRRQITKDLEAHVDKSPSDSKLNAEAMQWLVDRLHYLPGDSADSRTYAALKETLSKADAQFKTAGNALFYLATPPALFPVIPKQLAEAGLLAQGNPPTAWRRLIIEKPFGHDWDSARELNQDLLKVMTEDQIYRIDHYLGKETVQNMMVTRFANGIFEPIWNRRYVDSVQITVAEELGVESRGNYYDQSGALRDMVPNHLFQLISLIGMEPPNSFDADDVRDEKVKVLEAVKPIAPEDVLTRVVRGQYDIGTINGKAVAAYRREPKVKTNSEAETYVAMKLEIDNWRWAGVPFYLRTGKRLAGRMSEAIIRFRCAPFQMFDQTFRELDKGSLNSNLLVIRIQPDERIQMRFTAKVPGPELNLRDVMMDFDYADYFGEASQTGYETLLFDSMKGDATLFQRADQIEAGWKIVQPILDVWQALKPRDFPNYAAGSWGPHAADELLARDGRTWLTVSADETRPKPSATPIKKEAA